MDSAGHVGPEAKYTHISPEMGFYGKKRAGAIASLQPLPGGATSVPNGWMERERERSIYTMD